MKRRRAVIALGILIALASLVVLRRSVRRSTAVAPSVSVRAPAKPTPVLSASASLARSATPERPTPERPPYLDTTPTTLAEQRAALFTNMHNQLDLPPGAQDKIEAIFAASDHLGRANPRSRSTP
jgi:hypothetical protein